MKRIAFALACFALSSHGRSADESGDLLESIALEARDLQGDIRLNSEENDPLRILASSLLALNPVRRLHNVNGIGASPSAPSRQIELNSLKMTDENASTMEVVETVDALSIAKENLRSALFTGIGLQPDSTMQAAVTECIEALAPLNPTTSPSSSSLLNGRWEVVYAGAPGAGFFDSPTRPLALALYAAPFQPNVVAQGLAKLPFDAASLSSVTVTIQSPDAGQPRVAAEAAINILGNSATVTLRANLAPRSDIALREDFVEVEAFGQRGMLPGPLAVSRNLFVSFVDDEYLIIRDDTGLPNVLKRLVKFPDASEPSFDEDDSAPGAG
jgi:hypothetical protein